MIVLLMIVTFSKSVFAQSCEDLKWMIDFLSENHIQPKEIDSTLVVSAIIDFTESFDPYSKYLDQQTIEGLISKWPELVTEIQTGKCVFTPQFLIELEGRIGEVQSRISSERFWMFDYNGNRKIQTDQRANNYFDIEENWRAQIQFNILLNHLSLEFGGPIESTFDSLKGQEKIKMQCKFDPSPKEDLAENLYRSVLYQFDPYTEYFDSESMANFNISLSGDLVGLGIIVGKNVMENVAVLEVFPGSNAERNGIKPGVLLTGIETSKKKYDLVCISEDELNQDFFSADGLDYNLTVQSSDSTWDVILYKEILNSTEAEARSFILEGVKRLGYLSIPSFYFKDEFLSNSVSDDVAKAVFRLRAKRIDGLILDLRGNGGGSMQEAIDLISLFVDQGPLFRMVDQKDTITIRDPSRGRTFSGPLMVLVNNQSASASEIVAMCLKEQQRALVVGTRTYGKTTSQTIVQIPSNDENQKFLKYTIGTLYSLGGESLHEIGLTPTVKLPLAFQHAPLKAPYFRPIDPTPTTPEVLYPIPGTILQRRSDKRFESDSDLADLKQGMKVLNDFIGSDISIKVNIENLSGLKAALENISSYSENESFVPNAINPKDKIHEGDLNEDILLQEAYYIFTDWLDHLSQENRD